MSVNILHVLCHCISFLASLSQAILAALAYLCPRFCKFGTFLFGFLWYLCLWRPCRHSISRFQHFFVGIRFVALPVCVTTRCSSFLCSALCCCSGWILSISVLRMNLAVAVVMLVVAGFFTVNAILAVILLKMVRQILVLLLFFLSLAASILKRT